MRWEGDGGLAISHRPDGSLRIAWETEDWFGPGSVRTDSPAIQSDCVSAVGRFHASDGNDEFGTYEAGCWDSTELSVAAAFRVYANRPLIVFELLAKEDLSSFANGTFARPSLAWRFVPAHRQTGGVPEGTRSSGYQYSEFALPVHGTAHASGYFFAPHRPAVIEPFFLIAPDGRTLMLAPLNHFHEQIIAVPADAVHEADGLRCGWHGDLDRIPTGFRTELGLFAAPSPRCALDLWANLLRERFGTRRLTRYSDELLSGLSYWTDNGAVYYYRTEPGCDYATTLEHVVTGLRKQSLPIRSVQLDSWFYPHQNLRSIAPNGTAIVPPSGMLCWEPREDIFPEGMHTLRARLGNLPLSLHSRHFSTNSPYFETFEAWHDGDYGHPSGRELYDLLMANAVSWGAITYEQDWMVETFLGVKGLREAPGRAQEWLSALDDTAEEHGLHLQFCMATPADFFQTVRLRNVASIRTSGDYRYLFDNGLNWVWFLQTNAMARALGLWPFKDVFLTHGKTELSEGEPYAEVEALLSALSGGPVGIGDQLGQTERNLVFRCCREDGVLVKPDAPIAAVDEMFLENRFFHPRLLKGETYSQHQAGRWIYAATFNACNQKRRIEEEVTLAEFGAHSAARYVVYDWRHKHHQISAAGGGWPVQLDFQDWDFRVLCPLLEGDITVFGDTEKYATVGDRRISQISCDGQILQIQTQGVPGHRVVIRGYAIRAPRAATVWQTTGRRCIPSGNDAESWAWAEQTNEWIVRIELGSLPYAIIEMELD